MSLERVKLEVEINLDPVPGTLHTPKDARRIIQGVLDAWAAHYQPVVTLVTNNPRSVSDE